MKTCIGFAILLRLFVACFPHSGFNTPPTYGDFEAQRHWLEVTTNLKVNDWYRFDLDYWGLDYPPLTAYHSLGMGKLAEYLDLDLIKLNSSRGEESFNTLLFMRLSVLISEILVFFPAAFIFADSYYKKDEKKQRNLFKLLILQPGIILIDHGHFQYNSVCLGLCLLTFHFLLQKRRLLAAISFSLALNFKQISLYYAPAVFVYLLKDCTTDYPLFFKLAATVISVFALLWTPFFIFGENPLDDGLQPLRRIFPFNRGLFEDKVANFWCTCNVLVKFREKFSIPQLGAVSMFLTVFGFLPGNFSMFLKRDGSVLMRCMFLTSLSFFLFSFQIHEKSILFPLLPMAVLGIDSPISSLLFVQVSMFSMMPLLVRDLLFIPAAMCLMIYTISVIQLSGLSKKYVLTAIFTQGIVYMLLEQELVQPPTKYPDLWVVAVCSLSFCVFACFFVQENYVILKRKREKAD